MQRFAVFTAALLLPLVVGAASYTVSLTGDGTGFATLTLSGSSLDYSIITSGLEPAPDAASLESSSASIDLMADFAGSGAAMGSISGADVDLFAAEAGAFTLEVTNGSDVLGGAVLGGAMQETILYLPVAAASPGAAGTYFATDVRVLNHAAADATLSFEYYPEGAAGNSAPAATAEDTLAAGEQGVYDNLVAELFGVTSGKGAVRLLADQPVTAYARIYNDQRAAGDGTFGQLARAMSMEEALRSGVVLFLANQDPSGGTGFRSNIGWFNPNDGAVAVTLRAYDSDGSMLGELSHTANAMAQEQLSISVLWPALANYGDFYLGFSADQPIFVYGSVVDNVNGDAIYLAAAGD